MFGLGIGERVATKKEKAAYEYNIARQVRALVVGILIAYAITCAAFIACAIALTYSGLKESAVPIFVTATCVVSVAIAGFDAARGAEGRGWLWEIGIAHV